MSVLVLPGGAHAAAEDCGPGTIDFVQGTGLGVSTIEAIRVSGLGAGCEGQVVGARFLGNDAGHSALPATILSESFSDEDPCTGVDLAEPRVVTDGVIDILLCPTSTTAGFVDGHDLTDIRLITPFSVASGTPDPAVDPEPDEPLATTGFDAQLLAVGAALALLLGAGMLRSTRCRLTH